jgi:hypothetical protein
LIVSIVVATLGLIVNTRAPTASASTYERKCERPTDRPQLPTAATGY